MYLLTVSLASLLILHTSAAPQKYQDLRDRALRAPDTCGPAQQNPPLTPADSCHAIPAVVTEPSSFGILGISPPHMFTSSVFANWSSCDAAVIDICATMAAKNTSAGAWYFNSSLLHDGRSQSGSSTACQIGFWLPRDIIGPLKSEFSDTNAALKPSRQQCQNILNATIVAAKKSEPLWSGASINLVRTPENMAGQWKSSEGSGEVVRGEASNSGYPSYIITNYLLPLPEGNCLDIYGQQCDCTSDGQTCAPVSICRYDDGDLCECGDDGKTCADHDGGSPGDMSCLTEKGAVTQCG